MSIEDRVARLERENRHLKLGTLLGLLVVAAAFLMGQARPATTVEAETFVVRDRRGVKIASLGATYRPDSDSGAAWLAFYDYRPDGSPSIGTFFQGGSGQEGYLQLNTDSGNRVVLLRTGYDDIDPVISVTSPSGAQWKTP